MGEEGKEKEKEEGGRGGRGAGRKEREGESNNCAFQLNCLSEYMLRGKVYSTKVTLVPEILSFKGTRNISCIAAIFSQTN